MADPRLTSSSNLRRPVSLVLFESPVLFVAAVVVMLLGAAAVALLGFTGSRAALPIGSLISGVMAVGSGVVVSLRGWRGHSSAAFRRWLGAALIVWGTGQLVRAVNVSQASFAVFPTIGDLISLTAAPLAIAGVLGLPRALSGRQPALRICLDATLITVTAALVVWRFGFCDVLLPFDLVHVVAMVVLLADLAVVSMSLVIAVADPDRNLIMVSVGTMCYAIGDLITLHTSMGAITGSAAVAWPWVAAVFWCLAWPQIAAGFLRHRTQPRSGEERGEVIDPDARVVAFAMTLSIALLGVGVVSMIIPSDMPAAPMTSPSAGPPGNPESSQEEMVTWWLILAAVLSLWVRELLNARLRAGLLDRLHEEATSDPLTGLANRRMLTSRLKQLTADEPWCLLAIDLDGFKGVNDLLSHAVGDRLLCAVATRVSQIVPERALVCRTGGDEFAVLLPATMAEGSAVAHRVAAAVRRSCGDVEGVNRLPISASIGVAAVGPVTSSSAVDVVIDRVDPLAALSAAGVAMHMAKVSGRDRVEVFDGPAALLRQRRLSVEERLRSAIARGAIDVHFQPIVDLRRGMITGVEALARWSDPQLGTVDPAEFIPVAEQTGLVVALGELVLHETMAQATSLRLVDRGVRVSCNVSPLQLRVPGFNRVVEEALAAHRMSPQSLVVEVTEAVLVEEEGQAVQTLRRLVDAGITIAIDDFGTGYSALGYLRRLPAHVLKIDRSLTSSLMSEPRAQAITRAVIDLGRSIGLDIVVEGIETAEVADLVTRMGVGFGQGLLYGAAVPLSELISMSDGLNEALPA